MLGPGEADTMMEHLPPVGWGDVVTRSDVALLRAELDAQSQALRADFEHGLRVVVVALVMANIAAVGLAVGVVELLGG
ncbi:MAG: hypothetical protein U5R31_05195 [Acidimicrobiia bacterium]|nr:hypothetical protein [Acidimicrobiia bacterium]